MIFHTAFKLSNSGAVKLSTVRRMNRHPYLPLPNSAVNIDLTTIFFDYKACLRCGEICEHQYSWEVRHCVLQVGVFLFWSCLPPNITFLPFSGGGYGNSTNWIRAHSVKVKGVGRYHNA